MTTMRAVGLYEYLPAEDENSLQNVTVERPTPKPHDIVVQVKAVSLNPVDTKIRAPKDGKEEEPKILGWDAAGIVVETGAEVTLFQEGDEVYYAGSVGRQGANSEYHAVDERIAAKKPSSLDFAEAAAMPLTAITAWEGMFDRLGIAQAAEKNEGKSILIIGAAGGVGSIALQLAAQAGLHVIGTASRKETTDWAREMGADTIINHHDDFRPQLEQEGIHEVDYIFCLNATDTHWDKMADVVKPQGMICSIVETGEKLDLGLLKQKSAGFIWEFMFTRALFETEDMIEQHRLLEEVSSRLDAGTLKTTITERRRGLDASVFREAHQKLESGTMIGKLVIEFTD